MPTFKQIALAHKIVENSGNVAKSMREVGYSEASARNPQNYTSAPSFIEAFEKALPNKLLHEKHLEFLTSPKLIRRFRKGDIVEEVTETDSNAVRALDMAYKIKGAYKTNDITSTSNTLVINLSPEASARYAPAPPIDSIPASVIDTTAMEVKTSIDI